MYERLFCHKFLVTHGQWLDIWKYTANSSRIGEIVGQHSLKCQVHKILKTQVSPYLCMAGNIIIQGDVCFIYLQPLRHAEGPTSACMSQIKNRADRLLVYQNIQVVGKLKLDWSQNSDWPWNLKPLYWKTAGSCFIQHFPCKMAQPDTQQPWVSRHLNRAWPVQPFNTQDQMASPATRRLNSSRCISPHWQIWSHWIELNKSDSVKRNLIGNWHFCICLVASWGIYISVFKHRSFIGVL